MKFKKVTIVLSVLLLVSISISSKEAKKDKIDDTQKRVVVKKDATKTKTETTTTKVEPNNSDTTSDLEKRMPTPVVTSSPMAGEQINWQVISSGGTIGSSTNFMLAGTIGQTAVGLSSSTNYNVNSGFWQTFGPGGCCVGTTGDINNDGGVVADISDLLYLVDYMFTPGSPAPACMAEGDINGDGGLVPDISDLLYLVDYMFTPGSPAPSPCL